MWLKMDLDGVILDIQIRGYVPSSKEDWDSQWCKTDFSFSSGQWLNYRKEDDEVFLSCEIEELSSTIDKLLKDELHEIAEIACIEPDFHFFFHPKRDLRKDPAYTYVREGFEIEDIHAECTIAFWHEGLTDNYLSVSLDRHDLICLRSYLLLIMGKLGEESPEITQMLGKGILYGE